MPGTVQVPYIYYTVRPLRNTLRQELLLFYTPGTKMLSESLKPTELADVLGCGLRQAGSTGQALNHYSPPPLGRSLAGMSGWRRYRGTTALQGRKCPKCNRGGLYDFVERLCSVHILE